MALGEGARLSRRCAGLVDVGEVAELAEREHQRCDLGRRLAGRPRVASHGLDGLYALTVFVPLARGERDPPLARQQRLIAHVSRSIDACEARTGLRPRLSPHVRPVGLDKPPSVDPRTGVAHVGTAAGPPGEHAGAAALSGWRAAERALAASIAPIGGPS